jgi:mannose-1-phosphate guanylyltransferase
MSQEFLAKARSAPKRALLLAAGLGTRLRPITDHIPKCLVPIHGEPLLYRWLDLLCGSGVDEIIVNTHYFADRVVEACAASAWKDQIILAHEPYLLGTAGTLKHHRKRLEVGNFWLIHADNLSHFNVKEFVSAFKYRPSVCVGTMMTFRTDAPSQCGIAVCNEQDILTDYFEKVAAPPSNMANAAVFLLDPRIFQVLDASADAFDFCRDIVPKMVGRINTFKNDCYHRDIGTVASYQQALLDVRPKIQ